MCVRHYLYLSDADAASRLTQQLRGAAYVTEVRESDPRWLLRVSHTMSESEHALEAIALWLTELAASEGGEYDGWEREKESDRDVRSHNLTT